MRGQADGQPALDLLSFLCKRNGVSVDLLVGDSAIPLRGASFRFWNRWIFHGSVERQALFSQQLMALVFFITPERRGPGVFREFDRESRGVGNEALGMFQETGHYPRASRVLGELRPCSGCGPNGKIHWCALAWPQRGLLEAPAQTTELLKLVNDLWPFFFSGLAFDL